MNKSQKGLTMKFELQNCAINLFKKYGCRQVTIRQICDALGIAKTTFYYYYESKDDLILDFFGQVNFYAKEHIESILSAADAVEQLWNICELYLKPFNDAGQIIVSELFSINFDMNVLSLAPEDVFLRDVMITLIKRAKDSGQIRNTAPAEILHTTLTYALVGISVIWATKKSDDYDLIAKSREAFEIHLMLHNSNSAIE